MSTSLLLTTFHTSVINKLFSRSSFYSRAFMLRLELYLTNWFGWAPYNLAFLGNSLELIFINTLVSPLFWVTRTNPYNILNATNTNLKLSNSRHPFSWQKRQKLHMKQLRVIRRVGSSFDNESQILASLRNSKNASQTFFHKHFLNYRNSFLKNNFPLFNPLIRHKYTRHFLLVESNTETRPLYFRKSRRPTSPIRNPFLKLKHLQSMLNERAAKVKRIRKAQIVSYVKRNKFRQSLIVSMRGKRKYKAKKILFADDKLSSISREHETLRRLRHIQAQLRKLPLVSVKNVSDNTFKSKVRKLVAKLLVSYTLQLHFQKLSNQKSQLKKAAFFRYQKKSTWRRRLARKPVLMRQKNFHSLTWLRIAANNNGFSNNPYRRSKQNLTVVSNQSTFRYKNLSSRSRRLVSTYRRSRRFHRQLQLPNYLTKLHHLKKNFTRRPGKKSSRYHLNLRLMHLSQSYTVKQLRRGYLQRLFHRLSRPIIRKRKDNPFSSLPTTYIQPTTSLRLKSQQNYLSSKESHYVTRRRHYVRRFRFKRSVLIFRKPKIKKFPRSRLQVRFRRYNRSRLQRKGKTLFRRLLARSVNKRLMNSTISTSPKLFKKPIWLKSMIQEFKTTNQMNDDYSSFYEKHPRILKSAFVKRPRKRSLRVKKQPIPRQHLFLNMRIGRLNNAQLKPMKTRLLRLVKRLYKRRWRRHNKIRVSSYEQHLPRFKVYQKLFLTKRLKRFSFGWKTTVMDNYKLKPTTGNPLLIKQTKQLLIYNNPHLTLTGKSVSWHQSKSLNIGSKPAARLRKLARHFLTTYEGRLQDEKFYTKNRFTKWIPRKPRFQNRRRRAPVKLMRLSRGELKVNAWLRYKRSISPGPFIKYFTPKTIRKFSKVLSPRTHIFTGRIRRKRSKSRRVGRLSAKSKVCFSLGIYSSRVRNMSLFSNLRHLRSRRIKVKYSRIIRRNCRRQQTLLRPLLSKRFKLRRYRKTFLSNLNTWKVVMKLFASKTSFNSLRSIIRPSAAYNFFDKHTLLTSVPSTISTPILISIISLTNPKPSSSTKKTNNLLKTLTFKGLSLKILNKFTPTFINSAYLLKEKAFVRAADLSINSKYGTRFILSNLGFLYNAGVVQHISKDLQSSILRQKYSFFNIAHVKRSLIKQRGFFSIHKISQIAPHLRNPRVQTSSTFTSSAVDLSTVNNLLNTQIRSESMSHFAEPWDKNYRYTAPLREFNSNALQIRRIRFKPGYSRIWREARASLNQSLNLNLRYQYRLTVFLNRFSRMSSSKHDQLINLKMVHILLRSRFATDLETTKSMFDNSLVFLNGNNIYNPDLLVFQGDVIQLVTHLKYYIIYRWLTNWNLFKRTRLAKLARAKFKRMHHAQTKQRSFKIPNWVLTSRVKTADIPKFLEVDFFTLSAFIVYDPFLATDLEFPDLLESRFEIYNLYNWKYVT